jgi:hypothetical protein
MNTIHARVSTESACLALERSLRRLWPRYGAVKVEYALVEVADLRTVISKVTPARLEAARSIHNAVADDGTVPYLPVVYGGEPGEPRIAFGPLVERGRDELLLIDGVHRSLAAHAAGSETIYAVLIDAEHVPPPPGEVYDLLAAQTVFTSAPRLPLYPGRSSVHFRPSAKFTTLAEHLLLEELRTSGQAARSSGVPIRQ